MSLQRTNCEKTKWRRKCFLCASHPSVIKNSNLFSIVTLKNIFFWLKRSIILMSICNDTIAINIPHSVFPKNALSITNKLIFTWFYSLGQPCESIILIYHVCRKMVCEKWAFEVINILSRLYFLFALSKL